MRLALLSDVHGNLPALEAALEDTRRHRVDGYLVAGDYVGGPHQPETIQLLRSLNNCWMIRGNGDTGTIRRSEGDLPAEQGTARQYALARWALRNLGQESLDFLKTLPEERTVFCKDCVIEPSHSTESPPP